MVNANWSECHSGPGCAFEGTRQQCCNNTRPVTATHTITTFRAANTQGHDGKAELSRQSMDSNMYERAATA
eukprot:1149143-Pelagomonas_calceolata.AAC.7